MRAAIIRTPACRTENAETGCDLARSVELLLSFLGGGCG